MPAERGPDADHGPRTAGRARPGGRLAASVLAVTCALLAGGGTPHVDHPVPATDRDGTPGRSQAEEWRTWFAFTDLNSGFLFMHHMFFDADGARPAVVWTNGEAESRPSPEFLQAYRNHAVVKHGIQLPPGRNLRTYHHDEPRDVRANGYDNVPRFDEFDYQALVTDLFGRILAPERAPPDLRRAYLSIDIENGFFGWDWEEEAKSGTVPGIFRSGTIYYDQDDPDSPLNCSQESFLRGQRLQLQMCKLAELVRRGWRERYGEAPRIGWWNVLGPPRRIRLDEHGRLDGSGDTPPNTDWVDLTEEQKRMVLDRMLSNGRSILEGGVLPGEDVAYPGLDFIELNAQQQNVVRRGGPIDHKNQRAVDLGEALKRARAAGRLVPPAVVVTSWTYTDKEGIPEQGAIIPRGQVDRALVEAFEGCEPVGYLVWNFYWSQQLSSCFNLETPSWATLSEPGHFWAEEAWRLIWTTVASSLGTAELPGYRPTARATIGEGGFSDDLAVRDRWLRTLVEFLEDRFGRRLSRAVDRREPAG